MKDNSAIRSGFTTEYIHRLPQWIQAEQSSPFYNWDALIAQQETSELLRRIRPIPFYRYMTRYIVQRHSAECQALAQSLSITGKNWEEQLIAAVLQEVEAAPKRKPIQKSLTALVMEDFISNGCGAGEETVQGNLLDKTVQWDILGLREVLFGSTISDERFFLLALGMHMPYEDVELFLQKVLLRTGLDLWQPLETMLYLCIRHGSGNQLALLRALMAAFRAVKPAAAPHINTTSTLHTLALQAVERVTGKHFVFDGITPEIISFLEEYAGVLATHESYRRSSNRAFHSLVEEFMELTEKDRAVFTESMREPISPYAVGTVRLGCTGNLVVPKGTLFLAEGKKDGMSGVDTCVLEATETVSAGAAAPAQQLTLPVKCTTPVTASSKEIPGKTAFRTDLPCLQGAVISNYSKFKAQGKKYPDGKCYITGKLTVTCPAGTAIPKGTLFFAQGLYFESLGAVDGGMFLDVPVRCKNEDFYVSKNCVLSIDKDFPEKDAITSMENDTISLPRRNYLTEGELCSYLYHPADKPNYWVTEAAEVLQPEEYATLLHPILFGARLTPTRLTVLRQNSRENATRKELLTAAFLCYTARQQLSVGNEAFDATTQLTGMLQFVNEALREAGFHELYLPNPYDCLLSYLATCEEPLYAFKNIWGIYRGFYQTNKEDI